MKKTGWILVLVVLIPIWCILYLLVLMGVVANYLWENFYRSVYKLAGSPLDKK